MGLTINTSDFPDQPESDQLDINSADFPDQPDDIGVGEFELTDEEAQHVADATVISKTTGLEPEAAWDFSGVVRDAADESKNEGFIGNLQEAFSRGEASVELGQLQFLEIVGQGTDETRKRIQELRAARPGPEDELSTSFGLPEKAIQKAAELLPFPLAVTKKGLVRGVQLGGTAAAVTALLGQIPPFTVIPEEFATVLGAGATGFAFGTGFGAFEESAIIEAGLAFDEISDLTDEEGNKINPTVNKIISGGVGVINGLLEVSQIKTLLRTIPGGDKILKESIQSAIMTTLKNDTIKGAIKKIAGAYLGVVTKETAQEVVQETTTVIGAELAKQVSNALEDSNIPRAKIDQIVKRLSDTTKESALAFSVFAIPGVSATAAVDEAGRRKAKKEGEVLAEPEIEITPEIRERADRVLEQAKVKTAEISAEIDPATGEKTEVTEIITEADQVVDVGIDEKVTEISAEDTIAPSEEEIISRQPVAIEDIKEFEQLQSQARLQAEENISAQAEKDVKKGVAQARKEAKQVIADIPVFAAMDEIVSRGGLSRDSLEALGMSPQEITQLVRKRPGLVKNKGVVKIDVFAQEIGIEMDDLVEQIKSAPTKKQFVEDFAADVEAGFREGLEVTQEEVINEEIKILNKLLKKKTHIIKGIKKFIGEQTGVIKISEAFSITQRDALKAQLKAESRAARVAFSAGKLEATLAAKERQKALLQKQRARNFARKEHKRIVKSFKKVLKDTKNLSHMSKEQANPIRELIGNLDLTRLSAKKKVQIQATKDYLEANPETSTVTDSMLKDLARLEKQRIEDLTLEELQNIHDAVMNHVHQERTKSKIRIDQKNREFNKVKNESIKEMKPAPEIEEEIVTAVDGASRKKSVGRAILDTLGVRHDHYDLIVETLSGINSTMYKALFNEVKKGVLKQLDYKQKSFQNIQADWTLAFLKSLGDVQEWLDTVTGPVMTFGKEKVQLTRGQRVSLYRHTLNERNLRHIIDGGFGFRFGDRPNRVFRITSEQLQEQIDSLTDDELRYGGEAITDHYERNYEALNKVFKSVSGYELPKENNYFPVNVMPRSLEAAGSEAGTALEKFKNSFVRIGLGKGFLRDRNDSKKPIFLDSVNRVLNVSIDESAAYIGLEIPLSNASRLLYDNDFRSNLEDRYSKQVWQEIEKGLRDIAGEHNSYSTVEGLISRGRNAVTTAFLGLNPFVIAKQVMSLPLYNVYVKAQYLVEGSVDWFTNQALTNSRHLEYDPEYVQRIVGGFSRDVADVFKSSSEKQLTGAGPTIKEKVMSGITLLDKQAVGAGMQGAVLQTLAEFESGKMSFHVKNALGMEDSEIAELTPIEKMSKAYEFARWVTERTQPMFSPEHRSSLSRGSEVEKLFTQFASQTNQLLNMLRRTWREARKTNEPEAWKAFGVALFMIMVVNNVGIEMINTIRDLLLKREISGGKIARRLLTNQLGMFFFIRDAANSVASKIERGTFLGADFDLPVLRIPNLIGDATAELTRGVLDGDPKQTLKGFDDAANAILTMKGIPYGPTKQLLQIGGKQTGIIE